MKGAIGVHTRKIEEDCNDRLTAYREKNKAHRPKPYPAPEYFEKRWTPPPPPRLDADYEIEFRSYDEINRDELVQNLGRHRRYAIGRIRELVDERYTRLIQLYRAEAEKEKYEVNQNER